MKTACAAMIMQTVVTGLRAQTENPRGIYRMVDMVIPRGNEEFVVNNFTYNQYKICTDEVTLTLRAYVDSTCILSMQDDVFYYTGAEPKKEGDTSTLIYNSDSTMFTQKWWSTYENNTLFPHNQWVTEHYVAYNGPKNAEPYIDLITHKDVHDKKNPFVGTWVRIGTTDDLTDVKKKVKRIAEDYDSDPQRKVRPTIHIFAPRIGTYISSNGMQNTINFSRIRYGGKKWYSRYGNVTSVKWITNDIFAELVKTSFNSPASYVVYKRIDKDETALEYIIRCFTARKWR